MTEHDAVDEPSAICPTCTGDWTIVTTSALGCQGPAWEVAQAAQNRACTTARRPGLRWAGGLRGGGDRRQARTAAPGAPLRGDDRQRDRTEEEQRRRDPNVDPTLQALGSRLPCRLLLLHTRPASKLFLAATAGHQRSAERRHCRAAMVACIQRHLRLRDSAIERRSPHRTRTAASDQRRWTPETPKRCSGLSPERSSGKIDSGLRCCRFTPRRGRCAWRASRA